MNTDDFWANNSLKERESYLDGGRLIRIPLTLTQYGSVTLWHATILFDFINHYSFWTDIPNNLINLQATNNLCAVYIQNEPS